MPKARPPSKAESVLQLNIEALPSLIRDYPALQPIFEFSIGQICGNIEVISRFGRFPHRNALVWAFDRGRVDLYRNG